MQLWESRIFNGSHVMSQSKKTPYRPDIDVLRAFAILAVLLFHLNVPGFSGGFIGVDVFFVISGFLMTSINCVELNSTGKLDYLAFCERRMKRIVPALLATTLAVTIVSLLVPLATVESLRSQIISTAIFASNLYYWGEAGYFDSASVSKPLLHTWSLSVEAQFYVAWPLLLLLAWRRLPKWAFPGALITLFFLSFVSGLPFTEEEDLPTIFYIMPFRAFEFALGGLVYFSRVLLPVTNFVRQVLIVFCILLIGLCAFLYSDKTIFPAWNALLPGFAAAAYIALGKRTTFPMLFESRILLAFGKLSYAIYLVHWPIIVFYLHLTGRNLGWIDIVILTALSIATALILHYCVERRFYGPRTIRSLSPLKFGLGASLATLALTTSAFFILSVTTPGKAGSEQPLDVVDLQRRSEAYTWRSHRELSTSFGTETRNKTLVVGDSQAADIVNLLLAYDSSYGSDIRTFVSSSGCQIKFSDEYYEGRERNNGLPDETILRCRDDRARFFSDPRLKEANTIILAYAWRPAAVEHIDNEIQALKQKNASASIYVASLKDQARSGIWFLERGMAPRPAAVFAKQNAAASAMNVNSALAAKVGEQFLDLYSVICSDAACQVFTEAGYPIFFDEMHLTALGAHYLARGVPFYKRVGERLHLDPSQEP
jgi:peptidoglycan/LPS O-acetylase OafA/YrhL